MSYCRFSDGDLYAYDSCEGGVQFYVAGGFDKSLNRLCATYGEAYLYAKELRDEHGLDVPDYAIEALKEDALEEFDRFAGPNSAVAELVAENAKLRELAHLLLWGVDNDMPRYEGLAWSQRVNTLTRELGVEP